MWPDGHDETRPRKMTVTCCPFSQGVALEHWATRATIYIPPGEEPMATRVRFLRGIRYRLHALRIEGRALITPEVYEKRRSSMIEVPWETAEVVFDIPVPGRPDHGETYPVPLPPVETESRFRARGKWAATGSRVLWPVMHTHVSATVMNDLERGIFIARLHTNIVNAGHTDLAIKAASADYRESIIVTESGVLDTFDWTEAAKDRGVNIPRARRLAARYDNANEPIITTRQKQVP